MKGVENDLRQVEVDSIQDYIKEVITWCPFMIKFVMAMPLSQMETLLSGFQSEIGSISLDIKILQEKSMDLGLKLKNRKVAESKLAKFVEDIIIPPRMVDIIVEGEVFDFIVQKLYALRKPKTNIQILQQNVLLKFKF
ncbi:vacuolar protein sorting-associated protein 52 A-like isoform X2 [Pistacia vera]|uniref:vacuolar protein sorting-associated protein 52 A-like isoform X2 n=1 Tax=Pistacia vera TaxID=55513 RepID=UPI001262EC1D|nr:vacuolar protein sorting-associated protein 52 A-like isoform X2 [Pistacia vera]